MVDIKTVRSHDGYTFECDVNMLIGQGYQIISSGYISNNKLFTQHSPDNYWWAVLESKF